MIRILVEGDYACFTRPEMKVERVTYDIITPSAAEGLIKSIYWHPGVNYYIRKIYMLNPIQYGYIRRNEYGEKISVNKALKAYRGDTKPLMLQRNKKTIQQRSTLMLKNVKYIIEFDFNIDKKKANENDNYKKVENIITTRLIKGRNFHQGYLGCREFPVRKIELYTGNIKYEETAYPEETKDLGYMLHTLDYSDLNDIKPTFFKAVLKNGVLDLTDCEVLR